MASGPGRLHVLVPGATVFKQLKVGKIFFAIVIQNIQLFMCKKSVELRLIWSLKKKSLERHAKRNYTSKQAQTRI
jgi:hypothetical protein